VQVSVTDGTETVTESFTVGVQADTTPSFAGVSAPDLSFMKNAAVTRTLPAVSTAGNGTMTYTVSPALPAGLSFTAATRCLLVSDALAPKVSE